MSEQAHSLHWITRVAVSQGLEELLPLSVADGELGLGRKRPIGFSLKRYLFICESHRTYFVVQKVELLTV